MIARSRQLVVGDSLIMLRPLALVETQGWQPDSCVPAVQSRPGYGAGRVGLTVPGGASLPRSFWKMEVFPEVQVRQRRPISAAERAPDLQDRGPRPRVARSRP